MHKSRPTSPVTLYGFFIPIILLALVLTAGGGVLYFKNTLGNTNEQLSPTEASVEEQLTQIEDKFNTSAEIDMEKVTQEVVSDFPKLLPGGNLPTTNELPPELTQITITEEQLTELLAQQAVGQGIAGFTVTDVTLDLLAGEVKITAHISDGTIVRATVKINSGGKGFVIDSITLENAGTFASLKETALEGIITVGLNQLLAQYEGTFDRIEIKPGLLVIYLVN